MAAHSEEIASLKRRITSLEEQIRAEGTPANEFSDTEQQWLNAMASLALLTSPYPKIESTAVLSEEILERPGMLFAFHFLVSGMPRSQDNTAIANVADWLGKNIARFLDSMSSLGRNSCAIQRC